MNGYKTYVVGTGTIKVRARTPQEAARKFRKNVESCKDVVVIVDESSKPPMFIDGIHEIDWDGKVVSGPKTRRK